MTHGNFIKAVFRRNRIKKLAITIPTT